MANSKQTDLLKNQKGTAKAPKENPTIASIKSLAASQHRDKVSYTDIDGNKKTKKVTLNDPGYEYSYVAMNYMHGGYDTSNYVGLYDLIMNKVIVDPNLSFDLENKKLPKSLRTKTVTKKNKSGEKVNINMQFPGYRTAVKLILMVERPSGALNMLNVAKGINANVLKDDNGKAVDFDYWHAGQHGDGLGNEATTEAIRYLGNVLDHDGFMSIINKGISFLTRSLR